MAKTKVLLPQSGMGMQEAEVQKWLKQVGDKVEEGEILVELEAAKSVVEVPAPVSGVLAEILAQEGELVEVRSVLALMET